MRPDGQQNIGLGAVLVVLLGIVPLVLAFDTDEIGSQKKVI